MLLVVLVSAGVMGPYGVYAVVPGLVLAVGLALSVRALRRAGILAVLVLGASMAARALSQQGPSVVTSTAVMSLDYVARFTVAIGVGLHLFATTSPSALHAALRALRVPRAVAVTLVVMVRFLPMVRSESAAVLDGMRLRGLVRPAALLHHPMLVVERFTVPMIAASLRAGEDLASSAILRGLGSRTRPTALVPPRLSWVDAAWLVTAAALVAATLLMPRVITFPGGPA